MVQIVELISHVRTSLFYSVNIMGADVLAPYVARASATMILTMLNRNDSVSACLSVKG